MGSGWGLGWAYVVGTGMLLGDASGRGLYIATFIRGKNFCE